MGRKTVKKIVWFLAWLLLSLLLLKYNNWFTFDLSVSDTPKVVGESYEAETGTNEENRQTPGTYLLSPGCGLTAREEHSRPSREAAREWWTGQLQAGEARRQRQCLARGSKATDPTR